MKPIELFWFFFLFCFKPPHLLCCEAFHFLQGYSLCFEAIYFLWGFSLCFKAFHLLRDYSFFCHTWFDLSLPMLLFNLEKQCWVITARYTRVEKRDKHEGVDMLKTKPKAVVLSRPGARLFFPAWLHFLSISSTQLPVQLRVNNELISLRHSRTHERCWHHRRLTNLACVNSATPGHLTINPWIFARR